jgi:hypothetical protein
MHLSKLAQIRLLVNYFHLEGISEDIAMLVWASSKRERRGSNSRTSSVIPSVPLNFSTSHPYSLCWAYLLQTFTSSSSITLYCFRFLHFVRLSSLHCLANPELYYEHHLEVDSIVAVCIMVVTLIKVSGADGSEVHVQHDEFRSQVIMMYICDHVIHAIVLYPGPSSSQSAPQSDSSHKRKAPLVH